MYVNQTYSQTCYKISRKAMIVLATGRRRKRKFTAVEITLLVFLVLLNFMGISYAYWNDGLAINTRVTMGSVDLCFCPTYSLEVKRGEGNLNISFNEDRTIMYIEGTVSDDYKAFLHYCVRNRGSIPVKYIGSNGKDDVEFSSDALKVTVQNLQHGILEPGEKFYSETGNPKIHIESKKTNKNKNGEDGDNSSLYYFELEMPFTQWTP